MAEAVIVAGARTPIGKLSGALASFSAMELGGFAIAEALVRAGVAPDQVDYVLMGQVLQAGQGQITARQAAVHGGIPMTVPANTINKVCLSGLNTIYLADQMIRSGDAEIVVAGGMESMTQAPYLLPGARAGYRIGDGALVDSMMYDGLTDAFDHIAMGLSTEHYNKKALISRERQDAFSAGSHEKAAAAAKDEPSSISAASRARQCRAAGRAPRSIASSRGVGTAMRARAAWQRSARSDRMACHLGVRLRRFVEFNAEQWTQAPARQHQPKAHGTIRYAQDRCDLSAREILEVAQDDGLSQFLRQCRESAPQVDRRCMVGKSGGRFGQRFRGHAPPLDPRRFANDDARKPDAKRSGTAQ